MKAKIINEDGHVRYFDKNGTELHDGDTIVWDDGKTEKIYLTDQGKLGTDATRKSWVEKGLAAPCEYGIYSLPEHELARITKLES